jgi:hypothetical protein
MDYDKSMQLVQRSEFNKNKWYAMMKNELDNNRPIIYAGYNVTDEATYGHSFILDGYTTEDYFGVNWGWSGYCNGYFRLDAMNPSGTGTGGTDHYNDQQNAVIGVQKNVGGDYVDRIVLGTKGFNKPEDVKSGVAFTLSNDGIWNKSGRTFNGYLLWALADKDGNIKEELAKHEINNLQAGYGWSANVYNVTLTITKAIKPGDRIRFYYKAKNASEWTLVEGGDECTWEIILMEEIDIDAQVSLKYERATKRLIVNAADDIQVKLFTEDGQDISNRLEISAQGKVISASRFDLGTYVLRLEASAEQYREVKLKLGVAQ